DTWPVAPGAGGQRRKIADFVARNAITQAQHPLLFEASQPGRFPDHFRDQVPSTNIRAQQVNWVTNGFEPDYDLSDHGLFVAGIIHDIVPQATTWVYRVLNDIGGGDVGDVIDAITHAQRNHRITGQTRALIVNLSFGLFAPVRMVPPLSTGPALP